MSSAQPARAAALTLADVPHDAILDHLGALLDRLGLLDRAAMSQSPGHALRFASTELYLQFGRSGEMPAASDLPGDEPAAIGAVATALADDVQILRLWVASPNAERVRQLQQVQHLFGAAAMIASACRAERLHWGPAHLWSPTSALADAIAAAEANGLPPVLHFIAFLPDPAGGAICTRGLAHFGLDELRLSSSIAMSFSEQVRRLARLALHALLIGPMAPGAQLAGLEPGEIIAVIGPWRDASRATTALHLGRGS